MNNKAWWGNGVLIHYLPETGQLYIGQDAEVIDHSLIATFECQHGLRLTNFKVHVHSLLKTLQAHLQHSSQDVDCVCITYDMPTNSLRSNVRPACYYLSQAFFLHVAITLLFAEMFCSQK